MSGGFDETLTHVNTTLCIFCEVPLIPPGYEAFIIRNLHVLAQLEKVGLPETWGELLSWIRLAVS